MVILEFLVDRQFKVIKKTQIIITESRIMVAVNGDKIQKLGRLVFTPTFFDSKFNLLRKDCDFMDAE